MQLSIIRYVVAVAKFKNFTKAADFLYVSQPALSQGIQRLENELHVEIFKREHSKVILTDAGQIIVHEGEKMLALEEQILRQLDELKHQKKSSLMIGSAPSYQRYYLNSVLSAFQLQSPKTKIILKDGFSNSLCEDLLAGHLDIALVVEPIPQGLDFLPVFYEEILLAVPKGHPLTRIFPEKPQQGDEYPIADFQLCRNEGFIAYINGRRMQGILLRETRNAGFEPKILTACASTESANTMVFHGMGITLIPSTTVELCPIEQRAQYYRLRPGGLIRRFGLARRSARFINREEELFLSLAKQVRADSN